MPGIKKDGKNDLSNSPVRKGSDWRAGGKHYGRSQLHRVDCKFTKSCDMKAAQNF